MIEVSGRTYPVEIRYRPLVPDPPVASDARAADPALAAADAPAASGAGGATGSRKTGGGKGKQRRRVARAPRAGPPSSATS